jgi:hypothetical protein
LALPVGNNLPVVPPTIFLNFNKIGDPDPGTPAILNSPEYLIFLLGVGISASIIDPVLTDLITILVLGFFSFNHPSFNCKRAYSR